MIEEEISVTSRASSAKSSRAATMVLVKPILINRKTTALLRFFSANYSHQEVLPAQRFVGFRSS
jgi:hypothetical protein